MKYPDTTNPWGVIDPSRKQTPDEIAQNYAELPEGLVSLADLIGLVVTEVGEE